MKVAQSCPTLCDHMGYAVHEILQARILEWVALSLLEGIFPTQGRNPGLPHCRRILYHLSHQGRPRLLEWVAYPFSSGFSRPRNWTGVSCIAGGFFTSWAMREFYTNTYWFVPLNPLPPSCPHPFLLFCWSPPVCSLYIWVCFFVVIFTTLWYF